LLHEVEVNQVEKDINHPKISNDIPNDEEKTKRDVFG
jgi:hypothetical protein